MVTLMICCFIFWCKVMALEGDEKPKGMPGTSGTENKRPSSEWEKRWEKRWENPWENGEKTHQTWKILGRSENVRRSKADHRTSKTAGHVQCQVV